jgi:hypothetical protein
MTLLGAVFINNSKQGSLSEIFMEQNVGVWSIFFVYKFKAALDFGK